MVAVRQCDADEHKDQTFCWTNNAASVAAGSLVATIQACQKEDDPDMPLDEKAYQSVVLDYVNLLLPHQILDLKNGQVIEIDPTTNLQPIVPVWTDQGVDYTLAPVLVCQNPLKTVGLGDAISTTGLVVALGGTTTST
eukprot:TRINITY_DN2515_c0_g1_i2.p1 TRINITY_DN2515_c0_g1~~TRINITY_DN2515_c0_g1_i2.p1  ORF type:complete len:138 (+),score=22.55 TRINITY_DN2515_c0_g1_i2:195-608(+)